MKLHAIKIMTGLLYNGATQAKDKNKPTIKGATDFANAYTRRGPYNAGASVQPDLSLTASEFWFGAWGSTDLGGNIDLTASYSMKGFSVVISNYRSDEEGVNHYFYYTEENTSHPWEDTRIYQLSIEKSPLILSWNTIFSDADFDADKERGCSTYIQFNDPFIVSPVEMNTVLGVVPRNSSSVLSNNSKSFNVWNVVIGGQCTMQTSNSFSIPVFLRSIFNPATEDVHLFLAYLCTSIRKNNHNGK